MTIKFIFAFMIFVNLFVGCSSTSEKDTQTKEPESSANTQNPNMESGKSGSQKSDRGTKELTEEQKKSLNKKIQWAQAHRDKKDNGLWHDREDDAKEPPKEIGIVSFSIGEVKGSISKSQVRNLKRGMPLYEGEIVQTSGKAVCDLVINYPNAPGTTIRVKENSVLKISQSGTPKNAGGPVLATGTALFRFDSVKKDSDFKVETPSWVAGVRGTQFEIKAGDAKSQDIKVAEGKVITSVNIPEMELLQNNDGEMEKQLHTKDIAIEAGNSAKFSQEENYSFLNQSGLSPILKDAEKPEFENKINSHAKSEGFLSSFGKLLSDAQQSLKKLLDTDLKKSLDQFGEMVTVKDSKLSDMLSSSDKNQLYNAKESDIDNLLNKDKITCGDSRIPQAFLGGCTESHVLLKLKDRDFQDLYQYDYLSTDNYRSRLNAYNYFHNNCDTKLKAVQQKLNSRLKLDIDSDEKKSIYRTLSKLEDCDIKNN